VPTFTHFAHPAKIREQTVETIWEGDVKEFSRAYDLICIVDQIHDYAINQHRSYVMQHLEAWYARHEALPTPDPAVPKPSKSNLTGVPDGLDDFGDLTMNDADGDTSSSNRRDNDSNDSDNDATDLLNELNRYSKEQVTEEILRELVGEGPAWLRLKEKAKMAKWDKAQETRARNRALRELARRGPSRQSPQVSGESGKSGSGKISKPEGSKRNRVRSQKAREAATKAAMKSAFANLYPD